MSNALESEAIVELDGSPVLRKRRLFETGQMKLLALHLISLAPKYGYDIIKDIGEIVGGGYCPSAGTVYPTLNYLEEQQFVRVELGEDKRKQYCITVLGLQHLEAEQGGIEKILVRFDTRKQIQNNEQYLDIKRAMENLKASLRLKIQHSELSPEQIRAIAAEVDRAAVNIACL